MPTPVSPERLMELLPCPFCGGEATLERACLVRDTYHWVTCRNELCVVRCSGFQSLTERDAIAAWNKRATQPDAGAMAEAERIAADFEEAGFISPSSFDVIASALAIYGTRREAAGFARGVEQGSADGLAWCKLAHDWMRAHDQLLGWIQNNKVAMKEFLTDLPKIDLPKVDDEIASAGRALLGDNNNG